MEKKKITLAVIAIPLAIIAIMGVTYAWFLFYQETSNRQLVGSNIYLKLTDNEESINMVGAYPEDKVEARNINFHNTAETNNMMTFTIEGDNQTNKNIYYEIILNYGDEMESPYIRFQDKHLVFDLLEITEENEEVIETFIVDAESYNSVNNQRIYASTVLAGDSVDRTFKLRMWLSDNLLISDTNPKADYTETGANALNKHYGSIKVAVKGTLTEGNNILVEDLYNKIQQLSTDELGSTYVKSYTETVLNTNPTFTIQDTVKTLPVGSRKEVYYFTGDNAITYGNLLFGGFCWQIVRTTQDGGVKIVYNGKAENNQCLDTRASDVQINGSANGNGGTPPSKAFNNKIYAYGTGFTYSRENKTFTLTDYQEATWTENDTDNDGEADYKALIGKYTCMGGDNCLTLYYVGPMQENGEPAFASYTIGNGNANTQRAIGSSPFNAYSGSPSMVGYMYNGAVQTFSNNNNDNAMTEGTFGSNVTYDGTNYHLTLTDIGVSEGRHYRCEEGGNVTECQVVRYYYAQSGNDYYYIHLRNGETIESVMKEMFNIPLNDEDNIEVNVNRYNSSMKGVLENWYAKNLLAYNGYIDKETVYCNAREITSAGNFGGWIRGNALTGPMYFSGSGNKNLYCVQESDRFSVNNEKAKLTYPIGLLTENERQLMGNNYAKVVQNWWWMMSANQFTLSLANGMSVNDGGARHYDGPIRAGWGVRPLVTLATGIDIVGGLGTVESPYVINYTE